MTTSNWEKFKLLFWKNWVIQKRHYIQTIFEILIPVLACSILILVRGLVDPVQYPEATRFQPLQTDNIDHFKNFTNGVKLTIVYCPKNPILASLIKASTEILNNPNITYQDFNNALDMQNAMVNNEYLAGLEFPPSWANLTELPKELNVAVRFPAEMRTINERNSAFWANWRTDFLFPYFQIAGARNRERDDAGFPANYHSETFIAVQSALSRAFILSKDPDTTFPKVLLQRYPYPPYYSDPLLTGLEQLLSVIIIVAFFYTAINTVKYITIEKEKQLKEAMKIMGLPSWLHWLAWFVKSLALLVVSISLITILLCVNLTPNSDLSIFEYSDWTVLWVYLFVYSITTVCFCFMMSVFFSKANIAAAVSGFTWFIFQMPFSLVSASYDKMTLGSKMGVSLFSNSALSFGFQLIMRHEGTSKGLQWSNLFSPVTVDDNFSVGLSMIMLMIDALIYLLIALYVEKVMPGEFGIAEPWYFLVTKKFWMNEVDESAPLEDLNQNLENIEREPVGNHAGIQIRGLRKVFNKSKVAVSGLNLNMFEDQITVLLGHNGAGKTTTMSMLTGMFSPTSGTAVINGCDIRKNIEGVRQSLGLCPQHNVLFNELTVAEHITFFCRLKGVPKSKVKEEIKKYVELLELVDKENAQAHTLSGGMKRKLSIGVALCGNSKVVLCDEPTSGMDPSARRALWDLLQREKAGRTILLSTHFMDEADILGDRIAIMAEGDLKACGSSFFLKKKFGVGYRLICVKKPDCRPEILTTTLQKYIPNVAIESNIGSELSYILNEDYCEIFQDLLEDLESSTEACGIAGYGISLTTLEEVFLKIGSDSTALDTKEDEGISRNGSLDEINLGYSSNESLHVDSDKLLKGSALAINQIKAMFTKKMIASKRSWVQFLIQNIIPIWFISITVMIVRSFPAAEDLPLLDITLDSYDKSTTVMNMNSTILETIGESYRKLFNTGQDLKIIETNVDDYILQIGKDNIGKMNNEYLFGASFYEDEIIGWFNAQGYHTAPMSINFLYNAILKSVPVCAGCDIKITNKPLPFRPSTRFELLQAGNNLGFQLAFNIGFAMSFVSALFIIFYIKERTTRSKLLQFVSGVNVLTFWFVSFIWDFLCFIITCLVTIAILASFQEDDWKTAEELGRVFMVLVLFGFAALPLTYLFSFLFDTPSTGYTKMMLLNIFSGSIFFMAVFILQFDDFNLTEVANGLAWAFLIFPHFALSHSLSNINVAVTKENVCVQACDSMPICPNIKFLCLMSSTSEELKVLERCCETEIFSYSAFGINRDLVFLISVGVISLVLILLIEFRVYQRLFSNRFLYLGPALPETEEEFLDSDVKVEKDAINNMSMEKIENTNLVIRNMSKFYGKFLAVNQISVGVNHSECFGLLGVNGAGKTSTFKMLTGDENISMGEAWVKGVSLNSNMNKVYAQIGYCPQFDALLDNLTGRETMKIYALLRGIPTKNIDKTCSKLYNSLNFAKHIDKKIKEYSGGNKRKLSTALALIGNPSVIYLDEPTTGMDPGAKRQLWNVLCKVRSDGKSIILTSHSMEECEALCTRLAIMVNGEFKCIGSTQHLKNKFSKGFFLTIKINKEGNTMAVKNYIEQNFIGANLREEHQDSLAYHIMQTELKWSTMFGLMEKAKKTLDIEDYALGQTSLEQVFLFFTKYQRVTE